MSVDFEALLAQLALDEKREREKKEKKKIIELPVQILRVEKSEGRTVAVCICGRCGKEFTVLKHRVERKTIRDCGCKRRENSVFNREEDGTIARALSERYVLPNGSTLEYMKITGRYRNRADEVVYECECICGKKKDLTRRELKFRKNATCGGDECETLYMNYLTYRQAIVAIKNFTDWKLNYFRKIQYMINNGKSLKAAVMKMGQDPQKMRRKVRRH